MLLINVDQHTLFSCIFANQSLETSAMYAIINRYYIAFIVDSQ